MNWRNKLKEEKWGKIPPMAQFSLHSSNHHVSDTYVLSIVNNTLHVFNSLISFNESVRMELF